MKIPPVAQGRASYHTRYLTKLVQETGRSLMRSPRRVVAVICALHVVVAALTIETPLTEWGDVFPTMLGGAFRAAPMPDPCAPCGCSVVSDASATFCARDAHLHNLSAHDVPMDAAASQAQTVQVKTYLNSKLETEACYDALNRLHDGLPLPPSARAHTLYHVYIRLDKRPDFTKAQLSMLAGWMSTQDMDRSSMIVWVAHGQAPPSSLAAFADLFPGVLLWRILDVPWEAEGTPMQRSYLLYLHDENAWLDSDIARLVILWKYGGVWLDLDMVLTRDLTPLLGLEFATEFSCDHAQSGFNNAIMRFQARSAAISGLCEVAKRQWPRLKQWTFGPSLLVRAYAQGLPFHRIPWCAFHGRWCSNAISAESLMGTSPWLSTRLTSAFGLHLHGSGNEGKVHKTSILGWYEGWAHEQLLNKIRSQRGQEKAEAWEKTRVKYMLFGHEGSDEDWVVVSR